MEICPQRPVPHKTEFPLYEVATVFDFSDARYEKGTAYLESVFLLVIIAVFLAQQHGPLVPHGLRCVELELEEADGGVGESQGKGSANKTMPKENQPV